MKGFFVGFYKWFIKLLLEKEKTREEKIDHYKWKGRSMLGYRKNPPEVIFYEDLPDTLMLIEAKYSTEQFPYGFILAKGEDSLDCILYILSPIEEYTLTISKLVDSLVSCSNHSVTQVRLVRAVRDENDVSGASDKLIIYPPMSYKCLV